MKIKTKLNNHSIFKYFYILLAIINTIAITFLVLFFNTTVLRPVTIEDNELNIQEDFNSGRVNKTKFNTIKEAQKNKEEIINNAKELKNIF